MGLKPKKFGGQLAGYKLRTFGGHFEVGNKPESFYEHF